MSESPSSSSGEGEEGVPVADLRSQDPSSSRSRSSAEAVWPEHFLEAVAARVAIDAAETHGRLAAAPALANIFKVCSTWRSVSRSELLWKDVSHRVWSHHHTRLPSWREEFRRVHRTALNFRIRRLTHAHLLPSSSAGNNIVSCRRLALSDYHIAAGFSNGTVHLFHLPMGQHLMSFGPHSQQARLGLYSQSISGLVLLASGSTNDGTGSDRLVFAFQDGDVHLASLSYDHQVRRVNVGSPVENGPMVDFTGDARWWVGLFAGLPGRSWHVWDAVTEQLVYVGGSLTDPDSVMGWRMLTDLRGLALGRVRIVEPGIAVGCTGTRIHVINLDDDDDDDDDDDADTNTERVVRYLDLRRRAIVDMFDGCDGRVMVVDQQRRVATVRTARTLEEVCRFSTAGRRRGGGGRRGGSERDGGGVAACLNKWGYAAVVSSGGEIRMWDAMTGEFLYIFRERVGSGFELGDDDNNIDEASTATTDSVIVAGDRYVAAWGGDTGLHVWDFGHHV